MELIADFVLYMFASITHEKIDERDLTNRKKKIKKFILYFLIVCSSIILYTLMQKLGA